MIRLIFRTDVHASDRSPSSWKGDYPSEIWSSLEQIGAIARDIDAQAVLDGGDYFHTKSASRTSHDLVRRTAEIHREYPCPVYSIVGNHDITYNSMETLPKQPLGVVYATNVFQTLTEVVFERDGVKVRVVGLPYSPTRTLEDFRAIRKRPDDQYLVVVAHALATKLPATKAEEFFHETVFCYRDLVAYDGPDATLFGHWHKDQGVEEIEGKLFVNQGAVSRGSLIRENLERTPQVAILEATSNGITARLQKLRVSPASEVFDLVRRETLERESRDIDQFVEQLQREAAFDPDVSIEGNIAALDFAKDVRQKALEYLEKARSDVSNVP
jgi:DNA repair exonuclease SbcCD nuclease subunit